ncbi:MAG: hypothetical protein LBI92_04160 [Azoarcus sp.]|jgi:hypothetical protein|nr:hypothetical protein [Azoarcus sp.]
MKKPAYFRIVAWIFALLFFGSVVGYAGWKIQPIVQEIHKEIVKVKGYRSLPDPVVVKDDVYWFPLGKQVFAVPKAYVKSYGRNSTDGSLHAFSLHALLPDFQGYSPKNAAKFKVHGWGDRIDITARIGRYNTRNEYTKWNYYNFYLTQKAYLKKYKGLDPVVVNKTPYIEMLESSSISDYFFLLEGDHALKKIRCAIKKEEYQSPSCDDISVFYSNAIRLQVTYSRAYLKDWVAIEDQVVDLIKSFERPLDAFPEPSHSENSP